jgi:DNA-binding NarL/FixJ family response regulator
MMAPSGSDPIADRPPLNYRDHAKTGSAEAGCFPDSPALRSVFVTDEIKPQSGASFPSGQTHLMHQFSNLLDTFMNQPNPGSKGKSGIFVVDDHPLMRQGLTQLINNEPDLFVCGEAEDAPHALKGISIRNPDLVIVDISLQGNNGIELTKSIKALYKDLRIMVLSMHDEHIYAQRVLRAGANAYVMKQEAPDRVIKAIRRTLSGDIYVSEKVGAQILHQIVNGRSDHESPVDRLSDRELEIIQLIGEGKTTREIASSLNVSVKTVESHRAHIKEKLDPKNAAELVQFCVQWVERENTMGA